MGILVPRKVNLKLIKLWLLHSGHDQIIIFNIASSKFYTTFQFYILEEARKGVNLYF